MGDRQIMKFNKRGAKISGVDAHRRRLEKCYIYKNIYNIHPYTTSYNFPYLWNLSSGVD